MSALVSVSSVASAMPWISPNDFPGVRPATAEERAGISRLLSGYNVLYDLADRDFLVHEGDLHVPGHFKSTGPLLVRGDLRVYGVYDDDNLPYGIVAVLGNMQAQHLYSFASLYVQGNLEVEGVIATVYNDFTFEIDGEVNAAGLIVSGKYANFQVGELGFQLDDRYHGAEAMSPAHKLRHENGLRRLRPEFFSSPGFLEAVYKGQTAYCLAVDADALRLAMHQGLPLLRDTEAPPKLPQWLDAAIDFEADDASLLTLIGKDPLVDQLMAAREVLSPVAAEALAPGGDPIVLEWLTQIYPEIAQAHAGENLQPGVAQRLAAAHSTDEATLERIARSPDAEVRAALAMRTDPPVALIRLLAEDAEPAVRSTMLTKGFNVLALEPTALAPLIESADQPLVNALAKASLSIDEIEALLPRMDRMGHIYLAESLWRQALGAQPARMDTEQRVQLIDRLLSMPKMDGIARTYAFLALDGAQQAARIELLEQGDVDERSLVRLVAPEVADWMLTHSDKTGSAPIGLGLNRGLSPERQRQVLALSLKAPENERAQALADLADNDSLDPDVVGALMHEALRLGLPRHTDLADQLLDRGDLPKAALDALVARHGYIEDVALTLLFQAHADADQLKPAVARWYKHEDVASEAATLAGLQGEAYFHGLAKAKSPELRELAAFNHGTPAELIPDLLADEVAEVRYAAGRQPSLTAEQIAELVGSVGSWRNSWDMPVLPAEVWTALLARHQEGVGARLQLMEWAAIAELEARRRAQP
ncbi:hypothetical protein [Halopseudomonas salegens]|uniref:Uncharacterized protein n=1 Tax=Halopseudomonas salegens TaxID=1434072 RepID=A0A1H2G8M7_9GAMM|nr:hypothetical protein [Halopseudomonas salegens]SDU15849.1 hypothetical protein SAMN05216210_2115 [Halopseudomonas salegens]